MSILTGFLVLLISSIGHAEWWILFVNRIHAFRIPHRRLRISRFLHDAAIVLYPVAMTTVAGFGERGLLNGGRFSEQTSGVQMVIIATALGCLPLIAGLIRWQCCNKQRFHAADHRETTDLASLSAAGKLSGDIQGPRRKLSAQFPGNEFLKVEINRKTIRLAARSGSKFNRATADASATEQETIPACRTLRVVHFSDLHIVGCPGEGYYRWVMSQTAAMKPDAVFCTGDLIDDPALMGLAAEILAPLAEQMPCFFVLGNHDWRFDHEQLRQRVEKTGWISVAGRTLTRKIGGLIVSISGTELPWMGASPQAVNKNGAAEQNCDLRLLLSHSPDQIRFARKSGFDVMLAGHTHGGQIVLPLIGPVYSPSLYGVRFASGLFQEQSVALHVSRGIGAKSPMRWGCVPEVTCLTIEIASAEIQRHVS